MTATRSIQENLIAQAVIFDEVCYAIFGIEYVKNMNSLRSKRLFTTTEYYKLLEIGVLKETDRVELIDGEIINMPHAANWASTLCEREKTKRIFGQNEKDFQRGNHWHTKSYSP